MIDVRCPRLCTYEELQEVLDGPIGRWQERHLLRHGGDQCRPRDDVSWRLGLGGCQWWVAVDVGVANGAEVDADADGCWRACPGRGWSRRSSGRRVPGLQQKTMAATARVFPEEDEAPRASPSWLACMMAAGGSRLAS